MKRLKRYNNFFRCNVKESRVLMMLLIYLTLASFVELALLANMRKKSPSRAEKVLVKADHSAKKPLKKWPH